MHILGLQWRRLILAAMVFLLCRVLVVASDEPTLSKDQIKELLLTAKVVRSQQSKKGITNPWRLTLTDGTITHDASSNLSTNTGPWPSWAVAELNRAL